MNRVPLLEQESCKVGAILASNAGNEGYSFGHRSSCTLICRDSRYRTVFYRSRLVPKAFSQNRYSVGMKAPMAEAGTKYFAISFCSLDASAFFARAKSLALMIPSKHF